MFAEIEKLVSAFFFGKQIAFFNSNRLATK